MRYASLAALWYNMQVERLPERHACMMGLEALSSSVFFEAMYDDMVLSRNACEQPMALLGRSSESHALDAARGSMQQVWVWELPRSHRQVHIVH